MTLSTVIFQTLL